MSWFFWVFSYKMRGWGRKESRYFLSFLLFLKLFDFLVRIGFCVLK